MPNNKYYKYYHSLVSLGILSLSMISWGWGISLGLRVDWDTLIGNISNITVVVVSSVLDILGTAIGKSDSVRSRNNTISIRGLTGIESSL